MKYYLVGGAVRDMLLNLPVAERDWVVLGESPETMVQQGFIPVGKDFPVFLHPESHEEYALARTERKTAPGYKGFKIHSDPNVTLEQDLIRRDLTINAIAMTTDGEIIDPFNGQNDLKNKLFRHISPAFSEDPVRILRVARFAARYHYLGFRVAQETQSIMQQMVTDGEIDHLVPERVWMEFQKALSEKSPEIFFKVLIDCNALSRVFPEIYNLFGIPQPERYHPEVDTGIHSLLSLKEASLLSNNPEIRFAALVHDLGKALTPPESFPRHLNHEVKGLAILDKFCKRLKVPNKYKFLAQKVMQYHTKCHKALELRTSSIVDLLNDLGAFRQDHKLEEILVACKADCRGRTGWENESYPQAEYLIKAHQAAVNVDKSSILNRNISGPEIGKAIRQLRIEAVKSVCKPD